MWDTPEQIKKHKYGDIFGVVHTIQHRNIAAQNTCFLLPKQLQFSCSFHGYYCELSGFLYAKTSVNVQQISKFILERKMFLQKVYQQKTLWLNGSNCALPLWKAGVLFPDQSFSKAPKMVAATLLLVSQQRSSRYGKVSQGLPVTLPGPGSLGGGGSEENSPPPLQSLDHLLWHAPFQ